MNKSAWIIVLISLSFLFPVSGRAQGVTYDYPFTNPFAATVIGTPQAYKAELPKDIPVELWELEVFPDREVPDLLWYDKRLRYSLVPQDSPAPLIFMIAGTGAGYNSQKMQVLQRAFYQAGFHVLSFSSPTHGNFIVSASSSGVPGHLLEDSQDLYRVMRLAWLDIQDEVEVTDFYLTGYSLGAAQAAFVSKLDDEQGDFHFKKVLMINPPVSLYRSTSILDEMLTQNIPGGLENFPDYFDRVFRSFTRAYQYGQFVNLTGEFLYAVYQQEQPADEDLAALIGVSFRISSSNMIFTSDVLTNSGYIKPKNLVLSPTDSVTDYLKVTGRVSFLDYFREYFYPYFKSKYPTLTEHDLIDNLSLERLESYLRQTPKIGLVHNADDVIMEPGEINYLGNVFGSRAKIYPHGGHCGNLEYRDNIAYIVDFFQSHREVTVDDKNDLVTIPSDPPRLDLFSSTVIHTPTAIPVSMPASPNESHVAISTLSFDLDQRIAALEKKIQESRDELDRINDWIPPTPAPSPPHILASHPGKLPSENEAIEPAKRSMDSVVQPGVRFLIDIDDPLESFNRGVYKFNAKFDEYVFLPVVAGYEAVMPDFFEDRLSNFFSNIADINNFLNSLFQLKGETALNALKRLLVNSTFGMAGFFDHATPLGIPQQTEDFGQTLGHYGLGPGPYLVLPIFGPSNTRDTTGLAVDSAARYFYLFVPLTLADHFERATAYTLVNAIDARHNVKFRYYQTGSPFEYDWIRFLYTKKRELMIAK